MSRLSCLLFKPSRWRLLSGKATCRSRMLSSCFFILGLLQGADPIRGATEALCLEELGKLREGGWRDARTYQLYQAASRVELPRREPSDTTTGLDDMHQQSIGPVFCPLYTQPLAIEWIPSIVDFSGLPDMGRMDG